MRVKVLALYFTTSMALFLLPARFVHASTFDIAINFVGGLTSTQQAVFSDAELFWEGYITGYRPGISLTGISVDAQGRTIDGRGGILGQAGPDSIVRAGGFWLPTDGGMTFDSADLSYMESNGTLYDVILHELAHVIGFGTLWDYNNVYDYGTGRYTGASGLAAYQNEFDALASYVPVELGGGSGTANGHWDETYGGRSLTGIADLLGRDMRNELMTGWLNAPTFLSDTTMMSFADIGYEVRAAVPLPASILLLGSALVGILGFRKKVRKR